MVLGFDKSRPTFLPLQVYKSVYFGGNRMKSFWNATLAGTGAFLAIALLTFSEQTLSDIALVMAPFGATVVLVFGVPDSPLAQPKNVIAGHFMTSVVGLCFLHWWEVSPFTLALATGIGVSVMLVTKTTHPPAGANPMLIMLSGQGWGFLFTPVLIGAISIVLVAQAQKRIVAKYKLVTGAS